VDRQSWKEQVRKTAWASKKKKLNKKELNALQESMMILNKLGFVEEPKKNWIPKEKKIFKIGEILEKGA
jgi:hypothetical protein